MAERAAAKLSDDRYVRIIPPLERAPDLSGTASVWRVLHTRDFGFGVCRHGFGLQSFGDGYMTEAVATARAKALNAGKPATDIPNTED